MVKQIIAEISWTILSTSRKPSNEFIIFNGKLRQHEAQIGEEKYLMNRHFHHNHLHHEINLFINHLQQLQWMSTKFHGRLVKALEKVNIVNQWRCPATSREFSRRNLGNSCHTVQETAHGSQPLRDAINTDADLTQRWALHQLTSVDRIYALPCQA